MANKAHLDLLLSGVAAWNRHRPEKPDLRGANLREAYLREANLRGAYLREAYLRRADLREANLREADLRGADLGGALLCRATIDGARISPGDIGGPGNILCALTEEEWETIRKGREVRDA